MDHPQITQITQMLETGAGREAAGWDGERC